jgi:hypothetical protein
MLSTTELLNAGESPVFTVGGTHVVVVDVGLLIVEPWTTAGKVRVGRWLVAGQRPDAAAG